MKSKGDIFTILTVWPWTVFTKHGDLLVTNKLPRNNRHPTAAKLMSDFEPHSVLK